MKKDIKAFLRHKRKEAGYRPVSERIKDHKDVVVLRSDEQSQNQASRCMDCGTPFCHWACPVGSYVPEWNDAVLSGKWERAFELLDATNNLPEITGRICPAICEYACVLGINDDPVTIRENELAIIEYGFKKGYIKPKPPKQRTGKKVAVVGSGPAGITAASQLNRAGHSPVVFEKDERIGGIMRYGIPDFKLEKWILDRRLGILEKEGVKFKTGVEVGKDLTGQDLLNDFDAVVLTIGSREPRDLKVKGRESKGIYFAMDYLIQSNRCVYGEKIPQVELIDAKNKKVVVIGGGDTGSDCVGTANRQGAACVAQIEIMPKPAECRTDDYPWPKYPSLLKISSSHQEGAQRYWAVLTKEFISENGNLKKLSCVRVEFPRDVEKGCSAMREIPDSEFEIDADLVILAMGFMHPQHKVLFGDLNLEFDPRGNIKTGQDYKTSIGKVFAAGDAHRGQSLIAWAISEGRSVAYYVDVFLNGTSNLPRF